MRMQLGKKGEGGEEGLTLFALIFAMVAAFLILSSILSWYGSKKAEDKVSSDAQDGTIFLDSLMMSKVDDEGTVYDAFMQAYLRNNFDNFNLLLRSQIERIFKENRCAKIYIDGEARASTSMINSMSCTAVIEGTAIYPIYGKNIKVTLVVG